jgi:hypothetical protein
MLAIRTSCRLRFDQRGPLFLRFRDGRIDIGALEVTVPPFVPFSNLRVNTVFDGQQLKPAVVMDETGKFVVVWRTTRTRMDSSRFWPEGSTRMERSASVPGR